MTLETEGVAKRSRVAVFDALDRIKEAHSASSIGVMSFGFDKDEFTLDEWSSVRRKFSQELRYKLQKLTPTILKTHVLAKKFKPSANGRLMQITSFLSPTIRNELSGENVFLQCQSSALVTEPTACIVVAPSVSPACAQEVEVALRAHVHALGDNIAARIHEASRLCAASLETRIEESQQVEIIKSNLVRLLGCTGFCYWQKEVEKDLFRRRINTTQLSIDLMGQDRVVREARKSGFSYYSRLRDDTETPFPPVVQRYGKDNGWQAAILFGIRFNYELIGVIVAGFKTPILPAAYLESVLQLHQPLFVELLSGQLKRRELQLEVERLRSCQPLLYGGLIASLKIHDANGILGNVDLGLNRMAKRFIGEPLKEEVDGLRAQVSEVQALCDSVLKFSDFDRMEISPLSLRTVIAKAVSSFRRPLLMKNITLNLKCDPDYSILGDADAIEHIFINLLSNSIYFLTHHFHDAGGEINISCAENNGAYEIWYSDNGPGIPPGDLERIFDFLYSTKGREGTGVGLSVTRMIAVHHGGTIEAIASRKGGARFKIVLPADHG